MIVSEIERQYIELPYIARYRASSSKKAVSNFMHCHLKQHVSLFLFSFYDFVFEGYGYYFIGKVVDALAHVWARCIEKTDSLI